MSGSLLLLLLLVAFSLPRSLGGQNGIAPRDLWCVAKNNADDQALQGAINWACGPGGADCSPIQQGGPCYDPNNIQTTASWAFNDYYLKHGLTDDACSFSNSAALTSLNPSQCSFHFLFYKLDLFLGSLIDLENSNLTLAAFLFPYLFFSYLTSVINFLLSFD